MSVLTQVTRAWQRVLGPDAERVARRTGVIQRRRKLTASALAQGLVLGWLKNPDATLEQLAQAVGIAGVEVTATGLAKRFQEPLARCFEQLLEVALEQAIRSQPLATKLLARFAGVYLLDGTVLVLPAALAHCWAGCGGSGSTAALKLQVRLNLLAGDLAMTCLPGKTHELNGPLAREKLPAGALRLCDLGYFRLAELRQFTADRVWWITRIPCGTIIADPAGRPLTIARLLKRQATLDQPVLLGVEAVVPARLIVRRVSRAEATRRRRQARKAAVKHGRGISAERLVWCQFDVLATNLPPERLTADEAWVLAGARWQIEMLFKLWKSYGRLAHSRSENSWRVLTEIYAKLLGLLLAHWLLLTSHWQTPHRSWFKALRVVQDHALLLAWALDSHQQLTRVCRQIQACFALNCYTNIRNKSPTTYQLLENPILIAS